MRNFLLCVFIWVLFMGSLFGQTTTTGSAALKLTNDDLTSFSESRAKRELNEINTKIAKAKSAAKQLGLDRWEYALTYEDLAEFIRSKRDAQPYYDKLIAPSLEEMPTSPSATAYSELAKRVAEAKQLEEQERQHQEDLAITEKNEQAAQERHKEQVKVQEAQLAEQKRTTEAAKEAAKNAKAAAINSAAAAASAADTASNVDSISRKIRYGY
jgi:hypothetical protein